MTCQDILDILKHEMPYLRREFGLVSIGLFGSYLKGLPGQNSDIDLLVEFVEPRFDSVAGLQIYLEGKLGRQVDLVRKRKGLSQRLLKRIEQNIQYV